VSENNSESCIKDIKLSMTQVNGFAARSGKIRQDTFRHSKRTFCPAGTISCLAGSTSCRSESSSCLSRRSIGHPSSSPPPPPTTKRHAHSKSCTMILHLLSQEEKRLSHELSRSRSKPVHSVRSGSCEAPRVGSLSVRRVGGRRQLIGSKINKLGPVVLGSKQLN
jgi:hypothetical protein